MPAPTIPAGRPQGDGAYPGEEVRRIELEMPDTQVPIEMQLENLRRQFELDLGQIVERLQAVEGHLRLGNRRLAVTPEKDVDNQVEPNKVEPVEVEPIKAIGIDTNKKNSYGSMSTVTTEEETSTEVHFEESAWSIPILAAIVDIDVGLFDRLFAGLLILLNFGMQAAFSWVLLTDAFIGESFETRVESAKIWRTSVAHDYKYLDLADTSLVSRVCSGDGALILSTQQATLIHHINSFLGLEKAQFEHSIFQPGVLLSMICIILWTLCVYKEFRRIWLQLEAAWTIPRRRRTRFKNNSFISMSRGRFALLLVTYISRTVIASVLLAAGILWLARTTSIEELMLNAVALNAILDVDEFLFSGMTPIKIQHAIQNLKPIKVKYSRARSQFESFVHMVSLIVLVFLAYYLLLVPLSDTMLAVKNELCGGDQTFVVSYNSDSQQTYGLMTKETRDYSILSVSEIAVQNHKATSPATTPGPNVPTYLTMSGNKDLFIGDLSKSMAEEAAVTPFCIESVTMPGNPLYSDASMQMMAAARIQTAALTVGRPNATSCQELADLCDHFDSRLLRLTCGETCGCTTPYGSAWYKVEAQGCATVCLKVAQMMLQSGTCQDRQPDDGWRKFWILYPTVVSSFYGRDIRTTTFYTEVNRTVHAMIEGGCPMLSQSPTELLTRANWCQGMPALFEPLAIVCPQTCGCIPGAAELPSYCPGSCRRPPGNSSAGR